MTNNKLQRILDSQFQFPYISRKRLFLYAEIIDLQIYDELSIFQGINAMTYFEKFSRRFFRMIEKLLLNENRVFNGIPDRLRNQVSKDVIKLTLDSLRPEIAKIFDEAKQETAKEKKKELSDLDKTRQFLREVCNLEDKRIKQTHYKDTDTYEIVVDTAATDNPDYVIGFVFDKNKKFDDVRIVSVE